jgi:hypothetical protein
MNIDIEELKLKACNYLCVYGRLATKETRMIYKLGQALEQQQKAIEDRDKVIKSIKEHGCYNE